MRFVQAWGLGVLLTILAAAPSRAQDDLKEAQIRTIPVSAGVYMLAGRGGNIGLSVGGDGAFLVDDQFAPLSEKIKAAVAALSDRPVRFVINTHWHGDHTGGNENLGQAGAIIVAHENVRRRMSTEQFIEAFDSRVPPAPEAALPVITFAEAVTFHWNGDEIHVFHVGSAHTDGDSIIHFKEANVIHAGDTYFNGLYPFIDSSSGGTMDGVIEAVEAVLELANAKTRIIPGHGPISTKDGLRKYRQLLRTVRERVRKLMREGKSRAEVIAAKPTWDYDEKWGQGFLDPDTWVGIVYDSMQ
ncbi:MAG: MBL fold metallo-hydrolase [Acidobacteriota bacterium]